MSELTQPAANNPNVATIPYHQVYFGCCNRTVMTREDVAQPRYCPFCGTAMSEGKQEAREKQHCGCGTYYERTLEKCPDCGAANERRIIVGVTLSPERYNQLIQAESELAARGVLLNAIATKARQMCPHTPFSDFVNAFRPLVLAYEHDQPQGEAQPESGAMARFEPWEAKCSCQLMEVGASGTVLVESATCAIHGTIAIAAFQRGQQAMAEKAARLSAKWRKQAVESREEAGRIRRTVHAATDAEANCNIRAELWDRNADELESSLASVAPPQPDHCDECNTSQNVTPDGAHHCGAPPQGEAEKEGHE